MPLVMRPEGKPYHACAGGVATEQGSLGVRGLPFWSHREGPGSQYLSGGRGCCQRSHPN